MKSTINNIKKSKRGRPPVESEAVTVRVSVEALQILDDWRRKQDDLPGRPEAIRRLVELGLTVKMKPKQSVAALERAKELAAMTIDRLVDPAAAAEEKASRKRRLLKGPEEFREVRVDRPKAK